MCPNEFTKVGRLLFLLIAILGVIHVIGPTASASIFGTDWWLDWPEIVAFCVLAFLCFLAPRMRSESRHVFVIWVGWFFLVVSALGLATKSIFGAHIESPLEPILFFMFGIWAHLAGLCTERGEHDEAPL